MNRFNAQSLDQLYSYKSELTSLKVYQLPEQENWKVKLIAEIALVKKNMLELEFEQEHLDLMLDFVCTD